MKKALSFLTELEKNNHRDWFQAQRKAYDEAKQELIHAVDELIPGIIAFDSSHGEQTAKSAIFRINRDVRFSANKNPYKNNMGAYLSRGGKKSNFAGYYFHIQPGNSFIACGIWMPEPPVLQAIRQEIHFNYQQLNEVLEKKSFVKAFGNLQGEQLKGSPKGYDKEHPALDLLRYKSFVVTHKFSDKEVTSPDFIANCLAYYKESFPLLKFLNQAIELGLND